MQNNKKYLNQLDSLLSQNYNAIRLTSIKAGQLGLPFNKGDFAWEIKTLIHFEGQKLSIIVVPSHDFPYETPKIYAKPNLQCLKHPHVELNGKLCIWDQEVSYNPRDIRYVEHLINDAHHLLEHLIAGNLSEDFDRGFLSYWMFAYPSLKKATSLCKIGTLKTRKICVAYTSEGVFFADNKTILDKWLINKGLKPNKDIFAESFILSIKQPWVPNDYPKRLSEITEILKKKLPNDDIAFTLINNMLCAPTPTPCFLIEIASKSGFTVVGMSTEANAFKKGTRKKHFTAPCISNGLRYPQNHSATISKRASNFKLHGFNVERKDTRWILGRGENKTVDMLSQDIIGIIGLGSVGSGLLPLLVKAGFSKFILFDSDTLEAANISRHWLGDSYVGINKAAACESELKRVYPWVDVMYAGQSSWFKDKHHLEKLNECDLIISATGEWSSDVLLGELLKNEMFTCPVVFAFTEAHAVATHCYLNKAGNFQFSSLFSETGSLLTPTAKFSASTHKKLPLCGGYFQPYGAIELSYGLSMIAEFITEIALDLVNLDKNIHRVWIGSKKLIDINNAEWNKEWISTHGNPQEGSKIVTL